MTAAPDKPLAVSCGDPSGVGPEIAASAWSVLRGTIPFFWIGDPRHLPPDTPVARIDRPEDAIAVGTDALPVLPLAFAAPAPPGAPVAANARGVIEAIDRAVALAQEGRAGGIVTAPIHKKALIDGAQFAYPGHTEYLGALAGVSRPVMMLACDALRVVPVTIHVALDRVAGLLTPELLRETIEVTHAALIRDFGFAAPRIAMAGLNPHAGEGGAMGREEIEVITPVLEHLRAAGMLLSGPHSADTMFHAPARAGYDAAVCMYHDQALIPIKTIDFAGGVNVTLGLPFIRTSPDHGTAYDIAGKGIADPSSMIAALRMAARMARTRGAARHPTAAPT